MRNISTPFACSICKKEFIMLKFLGKHVELMHPNQVIDSNTKVKSNPQEHVSASKSGHEVDPFEFVSAREVKIENTVLKFLSKTMS